MLLMVGKSQYRVPEHYVEQKMDSLKEWLTDFSQDETNPSAAAQAKMLLSIDSLFSNSADGKEFTDDITAISNVFKESTHLIGFPNAEVVTMI